MSKTMKWRYKGEADVIFGEVKVSPLPKIALFTSITLVVVMCITAFLFRDTIYDMLVNPQIILTQSEVDLPYQSTFIAENYIDKVNTREYDSFMNQKNHYTYNIEGTVDTNILGNYTVTYNSSNRIGNYQAILTVHIKDMEEPTIKLINPETHKELTKTDTGEYDALIFIRDENSDRTKLGTNSWKNNNYIIVEAEDNCSENINITYPSKPDFSKEVNSIDFIATDESGNSSKVSLSIITMNMDEYNALNSKEDSRKALEEEIARLEQEKKEREERQRQQEENNNNPSGGGNNSSDDDNGGGSQPYLPSGSVSLTATDFTWSVSQNGTAEYFMLATRRYITYYGTGNAWVTSGPFYTFQPDGPGTYTVEWTCTEGLTCTQTVTLTE